MFGGQKRATLNKTEYTGKLQKGYANSKLGPWISKGKIRIKEEIKCVLFATLKSDEKRGNFF